MIAQINPKTTQCFYQVRKQARAIATEVSQLDKMMQKRNKLFHDCMAQYQKYIKKENQLLEKNIKHCQPRDQWFRSEVNKSWQMATSNRTLVLRSVARTNVLKKDVSQWLQRFDGSSVAENNNASDYYEQPQYHDELEGSKLIDKYNQILLEYGHKI